MPRVTKDDITRAWMSRDDVAREQRLRMPLHTECGAIQVGDLQTVCQRHHVFPDAVRHMWAHGETFGTLVASACTLSSVYTPCAAHQSPPLTSWAGIARHMEESKQSVAVALRDLKRCFQAHFGPMFDEVLDTFRLDAPDASQDGGGGGEYGSSRPSSTTSTTSTTRLEDLTAEVAEACEYLLSGEAPPPESTTLHVPHSNPKPRKRGKGKKKGCRKHGKRGRK